MVNRSTSFIYLTWEEMSHTCHCEHDLKMHLQTLPANQMPPEINNCMFEDSGTICQCKKYDALLKKHDSGHIIREKSNRGVQTFDDINKTNFVKIATIKRWVDGLQKSKIKNWKFMLTNFWRICTTLDVHPDLFLQEIETAEELKDKFVLALRDGKAVYIYNLKQKDPEKQSRVNPQPYIESIRSFRDRNSKDLPKGYLIIERHSTDSYSKVHLTDKERKLAIEFITKNYPQFSNLFIIHHEIGVRIDTLFKIRPIFEKKYTIIDGQQCEYWKATIPEKKQNRNFEKYFWTPEAVEVIANLKSGKPIHDFQNIREAKEQYNKTLRSVYAMLGKISSNEQDWKKYEMLTEEYYYVEDPSHAIRHSCIHKLMRMTGERSEDVASMFWDAPETLKLYKKNSIDAILQQGLCMICNPPPKDDNENERFCTLRHAVLYYNGYRADTTEQEEQK